MKRILLNIAILGTLTAMFTGCDTDIEEQMLQVPYKYTDEYYANLRAYKAGMRERSLCFVWFAEYASHNTLAYRFAGLPDSVDICSVWGGIPDPELNPIAYKEMWEMRHKKGTLLVAPTLMRIMENENYANFGLTREDMVNQTISLDPTGTYPDWIVLYGDHLLKNMWDAGIDGLDLDYEPETSDEQAYGVYGDRMTLLVKYIGQFIGPKSPNPDKLLIVDFYSRYPPSDTEPYVDYFVRQAYTQGFTEHSAERLQGYYNTWMTPEKFIVTENIGDYWYFGGSPFYNKTSGADRFWLTNPHTGKPMYSLNGMAWWNPTQGRKGGFGAFYCQRDYNTTASGGDKDMPYGHLRTAIQIQNPAVVK